MKNKKNVLVVAIVLFIGLGFWYFWGVTEGTIEDSQSKQVVEQITKPIQSNKAEKQAYSKPKPAPTEKELLQMIKDSPVANKIFTLGQGRNKNISFYGKVIDQHGEPVSHAKVTFNVGRWSLLDPDSYTYFGHTDANGMVEFKEEGFSLSVRNIEKQGYDVNTHGAGFRAHAQYQGDTTTKLWKQTSKDKPYIFHAWKKTEAEGLYHGEYKQKIHVTGSFQTINIPTMGDVLSVKFDLDPNGEPYKPENWVISLKAKNGGFIESNNEIFMNIAPETGYEPVWSKSYMKGTEGFTDEDRKKFYFRSGSNYGRMEVNYVAYYKEGIAGILRIKYWINPNSSHNLQYDPAKRIYPK